MAIAQEEIFGAVAAIQKFKTEEKVITKANNTNYGLGSYFYTETDSRYRSLKMDPATSAG